MEPIPILQSDLNSLRNFKNLYEYINELREKIRCENGIDFNIEEISNLLLSGCRLNDFDIIRMEGKRKYLNNENVLSWFKEK